MSFEPLPSMKLHLAPILSIALAAGLDAAPPQCTVGQLHGPGASPYFGLALSASSDRVLVGSLYDSELAPLAGAAFVYELSASGFTRETLLPLTPTYDGRFGQSVAMCRDQALVGALDDELGDAAGAVFVYGRASGAWCVTQKLTASDAHAGGNFGVAMAVSGERIVVGASGDLVDRGSAYVFEREGDAWHEVAVLRPSTPHTYSNFGCAVAIDGARVVVGFFDGGAFPTLAGAAFVFEEIGGAWVQTERLQPAGLGALDFFASAVAIDGDRIVVGAQGENGFTLNAGAVYVYELAQGSWTQVARLVGSPTSRSAFGQSVALDDERIAVGSGRSWVTSSASQYVETFRGSAASWTSEGYVVGSGADFGLSVAMWNGAVLAGGDSDLGVDSVRLINVAGEAQLFGGRGELSFSAQDEQPLVLTTCSSLGGAPYRLLGSLSGTGGFAVGAVLIPLTLDRYTRLTIVQPSLTTVGGAGMLDASGSALARVRLQGAAQAVFVGHTLHHAAVVVDGAGAPLVATNAVAVRIVP